jgi:hypothetical protein
LPIREERGGKRKGRLTNKQIVRQTEKRKKREKGKRERRRE